MRFMFALVVVPLFVAGTPSLAAEGSGEGIVRCWESASAQSDIKIQDVYWEEASGDFIVLESEARAIFRIAKQQDPHVILDMQSDVIPEVRQPICLMPRTNPPGLTVVGAMSWVAFDTSWSVLGAGDDGAVRYSASTSAFGSVFVNQDFRGPQLMISTLDRSIDGPWWVVAPGGQKRSVGALYSRGLVVLTLDDSKLLLRTADAGSDKLRELFTIDEGNEQENIEVAKWKSDLRSRARVKLPAMKDGKRDQKQRAYGMAIDSRDRIWLVREFWPNSGRTQLEAFSLQGESLARLSLKLYCPKPRTQGHYLVLAGTNGAGRTVLQVVDADVVARVEPGSGEN